jgi:hypothetical protein
MTLITGRRDPAVSGGEIGFSDCDLGAAALIAFQTETVGKTAESTAGHALRKALARRLRAFFVSWRAPRGGHLPEGEIFIVSEAGAHTSPHLGST